MSLLRPSPFREKPDHAGDREILGGESLVLRLSPVVE